MEGSQPDLVFQVKQPFQRDVYEAPAAAGGIQHPYAAQVLLKLVQDAYGLLTGLGAGALSHAGIAFADFSQRFNLSLLDNGLTSPAWRCRSSITAGSTMRSIAHAASVLAARFASQMKCPGWNTSALLFRVMQEEKSAAVTHRPHPPHYTRQMKRFALSAPGLLCLLATVSLGTGQAAVPIPDAAQMSIVGARAKAYPGSPLRVEQTLTAGSNYRRWVVSYQSDGLKIYALLTVPNGPPPKGGWPAVVFNHGYIPPSVYRTKERYVAYQAAFARAGFATLKSDYRGHGRSQGEALLITV